MNIFTFIVILCHTLYIRARAANDVRNGWNEPSKLSLEWKLAMTGKQQSIHLQKLPEAKLFLATFISKTFFFMPVIIQNLTYNSESVP